MKPGLNRFTWDFRSSGLVKVPNAYIYGADYRGHRVSPGNYTAKMTYGEIVSEVNIVLLDPPDIQVPASAWEAQQALMESLEQRINEIHNSINTSVELNQKVKSIGDQIKEQEGLDGLKNSANDLSKKLEEWQSKVIELRQKNFQDALNWPAGMNAEFFMLRNNLDTYDPSIPEGYKQRFQDLESQWIEHQKVFNEILEKDVQAFNKLFEDQQIPALEVPRYKGLNN